MPKQTSNDVILLFSITYVAAPILQSALKYCQRIFTYAYNPMYCNFRWDKNITLQFTWAVLLIGSDSPVLPS
jgi:hypothetical protein